MRATASSAPICLDDPAPRAAALVMVSSVVKVLEADDEQRLVRVEVVGCLGEIGAVDIGDEAELDIGIAVVRSAR